ncbi:hypothetical protein M0805_001356 [Coniferiporia weirii]|nr:hypothetical protein M0805_001356 [Coniferiporia weirii]
MDSKFAPALAFGHSFNFHGFQGARLLLYQNVHGNGPRPRSWFIKLLSPLLFYSPETQLARLEAVCSDGMTRMQLWNPLKKKLERDWEGFVLYSTVLLNANVAFLAIPTVISDNNVLWISPAAVASQVSIIASLGSIITSLILVRLSPIGVEGDEDSTLDFLNNRTFGEQSGFETLAVLYSLPYSLLMWGIVTFLVSVAILCFYSALGDVTIVTRLIYGAVWILVMLFITRTLLVSWEVTHRKDWRALLPAFVLHPRDSWREWQLLASALICHPQKAWRKWRKRGADEEVAEDGANKDSEPDKISTYSAQSTRSFRSARSRFTEFESDVLPN